MLLFLLLDLGLSAEYLNGRGPSLSDIHGAVNSSLASADFHFSLDGSNGRLSNSRDAAASGMLRASVNRKRALSSSPYSDSFDINTMIRFSLNSLATMDHLDICQLDLECMQLLPLLVWLRALLHTFYRHTCFEQVACCIHRSSPVIIHIITHRPRLVCSH